MVIEANAQGYWKAEKFAKKINQFTEEVALTWLHTVISE